MSSFFWTFFLLVALLEATSFATVIPKNLGYEGRIKILEVLGYGSTVKFLSSPAPLGGYSGVEIGVTNEYISLEDLKRLGTGSTDSDDYIFHNFTFGKGLYYNFDIFLSFTPVRQVHSLSSYGGLVRWNFFQAEGYPATISLVTYSGGSNFSNLIGTNTLGMDFIVSMNLEDLSLYFGGGKVRAIGTFVGGAEGITDSGNTEQEDVFGSHSLFGITFKIEKYFLVLEIDRYTESFYSAKLGMRF